MNLVDYSGSDDDSPPPNPTTSLLPSRLQVNAAPPIDTTGLTLQYGQLVRSADTQHYHHPSARTLHHNPTAVELYSDPAGPHHPHRPPPAPPKNHRSGHVEVTNLHTLAFEQQYHSFDTMGVAHDPSGAKVVQRLVPLAPVTQPPTTSTSSPPLTHTDKRRKTASERRIERDEMERDAERNRHKPWTILNRDANWKHKAIPIVGLSEEQRRELAIAKGVPFEAGEGGGVVAATVPASGDGGPPPSTLPPTTATTTTNATSIFHGASEKDYQGRSWMDPPREARPTIDQAYLPKATLHAYAGHTKGVQRLLWFPNSAHLLLSAGLDGKVKVWDVYNDKRCMRTYLGHDKGVRDVCFSNDGRRFVTTSFDKTIKVWDTETGHVISTLHSNQNKMHYCVTLHPHDDKQSVLLAGCADRKIYQFDLNTGDTTQEYDRHLSAVNSITFINQDRWFATTSDDKTVRVWEFGIPEQIKYLSDPTMHAIPFVSLTPNGKWLLCQSMDNSILTYGAQERVSLNRKKTFRGHNNVGYAAECGMSPDGKYVVSGDGQGRVFFWDWKTTKIARTIKAHEGPCMGALWHPHETSKVATCAWNDPVIKLWD